MDKRKGQQQVMPSLPMQKAAQKIKPLKLVMKYEPPIIGILYTIDVPGMKAKRHIYNILLNDLINNPNTEEITAQLFMEHQEFLNENIVSFAQIHNLVTKIQDYFINLANMDEDQMQQYMAAQAMRAQQMGYPQGLEDMDLENMDEEQLKQLYMYQQQQQQEEEEEMQRQQQQQSQKKQGGRKRSF